MPLATLQDIWKAYDPRRPLLQGVSLVIGETDRIGLVGANGAGKSTLLRILAGTETPDQGGRSVRSGLRTGWLEQEPQLPAGVSVRAAVLAGLEGRAAVLAGLETVHEALAAADGAALARLLARQEELEERLAALGGHDPDHTVERYLQLLGLRDPEAACGTLSGGERRRVALARLLLSDPDLLLLDEPTNHLDAEAADFLEDRLMSWRRPFVLVTHDRYFLDRAVDRIAEIEAGRLRLYAGGYGDYLEARAARLEADARAEESRRLLLRRETAWMRRGPPARSTKAKARVHRYEALRDSAPDRPLEFRFAIPPGPRLGDRVLRLQGAAAVRGGRTLFHGLDLELQRGDRLGIVGPNGAGKTTLLGLCTGALEPDAGTVEIGRTVRFVTIRQDRSELDPDATVVETVAGQSGHVRTGDRLVHVEGFLDRFLFPGDRKRIRIRHLSGGERNRVLLAGLLCAGGNVLVLDEPTNDLDLPTLRILEEALLGFPGCVLAVSHDRFFLDRVATRILHLDGRGGHRHHSSDLSRLLEILREERKKARPAAAAPRPRAPARQERRRPRRLSWREKQELAGLPDALAVAEAELEALDERLGDPALYSGGGDPAAVARARTAAAERVESLFRRWEELEALRPNGGA